MGFFDSIGDFSSVLNTGINAFNAYSAYDASQNAAALANKTFDTIAGSTAKQDEIAQELFDRYKNQYWPLEDQQISQAKSWYDRYTPAIQDQQWADYQTSLGMQPQFRQVEQGLLDQAKMTPKEWGDQYASQAHADTQTTYDNLRKQSERALGRAGVDPTSGRSITALQSGMNTAQALTDVGAQTTARQQGYDTAWNRGAGIMNYSLGNSMPTQTSVASGTSLSGQALSGLGTANTANTALMNSALQSASGASSGLSSSLNALLGTGSGSLKGATDALKGYV